MMVRDQGQEVLLKRRFMCLFLVIISSLKKCRKSSRVSVSRRIEREPQKMARHSTPSAAANTTTDRSTQLQLAVDSAPSTCSATKSAAQKSSSTCALSAPPADFICTTRCSNVEQKLLQFVVSTGYMNEQFPQGAVESRSYSPGTAATGKLSAPATAAEQAALMLAGSGRQRSASRQLGSRMSLAAASRSAGVCWQQARALSVRTECSARKTTCRRRKMTSTTTAAQYLRFSSWASVSGEQSNLILTSCGFLTRANSILLISSRLTTSLNSLSRCHSDTCASTWRTMPPITAIFRSSSSRSNLKKASSVSLCPRSRRCTTTSSHAYSAEHTHRNPSRRKKPERTSPTLDAHTACVSANLRSNSATNCWQLATISWQQRALEGGMVGTGAEAEGRGLRRRRCRVAGTCVLKRQYLFSRMVSPRKVVQLRLCAQRQGSSSSSRPSANCPTYEPLGLKMLFMQIIAAMLRRTTAPHRSRIVPPVPATAAMLRLNSTTETTLTTRTQRKSELLREREGLKLDSGADALPFSSLSFLRRMWCLQMLVSSKEVRLALNCPKTSCSMGKICGPSGRTLKLESMRRSARSSSLKIDSSCFSEPSARSLVGSAMERSVRLLPLLKESVSMMAATSEKFSTWSKCLITKRSIRARPPQKERRVISTSAKHAPTNSSSFSIRRNVPSSSPWKRPRSSSPAHAPTIRLGSRDFWFLKKSVRTQTPSESMYLMSVGKSGRTLKFLRSAMESSSRLNSSAPILRVHPSRKPNSSVRITLASLSTRSITPAIRKQWKSVITQLQCTRTSCR